MRGFRAVFFWTLLCSMPVSACLFRVWVHQDVIRLGYDLTEQERESRRLGETLRQLEVELAEARSPARLTRLAQKLGLSAPAPDQILAAPSPVSQRTLGLARMERALGRP